MKEGVVSSSGRVSGLGTAGGWGLSVAHLSIASWVEDWVMGVFVRWRISKRTVGRSRQNGACRSEGLGLGEHVPDRLGEPASDIDLSDFGAALAAQTSLVALVTLGVDRVAAGGGRGFHQRPAQVLRSVLGQRTAAIGLPALNDAGAKAGVAGELGRARRSGGCRRSRRRSCSRAPMRSPEPF